MPAEIDFSKGVRGKFYRPGMRLRLPIYLDDETQRYLADRAQAKGWMWAHWSISRSRKILS